MRFQVFLYNAINLKEILWFQVTNNDYNNQYKIIAIVFLNWHAGMWYQAFRSNISNVQTYLLKM